MSNELGNKIVMESLCKKWRKLRERIDKMKERKDHESNSSKMADWRWIIL